jgi:hypothetical protein
MDNFQMIVLAIAVLILIVILTFIGITLATSKKSVVFPPVSNTCPDYWQVSSDGKSCTVPSSSTVTNTGSIFNKDGGKLQDSFTTTKLTARYPFGTPGYSDGIISFSDAGWTSNGKSAICQQKSWANNYGIQWDGVSNYNRC